MGKEQEAYALSCEVVAQGPIDENSLQGLSLYYKECHKSKLNNQAVESSKSFCVCFGICDIT